MPAKSNDLYRVFPYIDLYHKDKEHFGYVFIRIASKENRNKNFNIPVYLPDRTRLKLRKEHLGNFQVVNMQESKLKSYNTLIDKLVNHFVDFTSNSAFTKKTLEHSIYDRDFLEGAKGKQIRFQEIEIEEQVPTDYYLELRKLYPKKEDIERITTVDKDGFEVIMEKPVVIDPLSLDDFPNNFSPEVYERMKTELLEKFPDRKIIRIHKSKDDSFLKEHGFDLADTVNHYKKQKFETDVEKYIREKLFTTQIKEVVPVSKEVIKEFKSQKPNYKPDTKSPRYRILHLDKTEIDIHREKLPTEERYKEGYYTKTNIFELFGSIRYNKLYAEEYRKIVIRLFQYRHFAKPKENIGDLSEEWLTDFFKYLWTTGYYSISTKNFDPLKFDGSIFKGKKIIKYKSDQIHSLRNIMRTVINKFLEDGSLKPEMKLKIEFPKISKITGKPKGSGKKSKNDADL